MLEQPQEEETKELKTTSVEIKMTPEEDNTTDSNIVPQSLEETEKAKSPPSNNNDNNDGFYSISKDYWAKQPPTVNGMLGGYEYVSQDDIEQSQQFLNYFINTNESSKHKCDRNLALDCGAGIGRVSKHLLLKNFANVEMVDVTENFVNKATEYLGQDDAKRVLKFHCCGLQSFYPEQKKYDIVWIQWVLGYLKDNDAIDFLKRCKASLKPNGMCILKENVCVGEPELDEIDASYTRPRKSYLNLIHKAEMFVIRDEKQRKFPAELYEVRLFAFK